jgi:hypothetical protein
MSSRSSLGRKGGGGDANPNPATHGFFPPHSSVQLVPPRLPDNANHPLPVSVTILDAQAPSNVPPINNMGIPWMPTGTNSAGPGHTGIGAGDNGGVGDRDGSGDGEGDGGISARGISMPVCIVCPIRFTPTKPAV